LERRNREKVSHHDPVRVLCKVEYSYFQLHWTLVQSGTPAGL